MREIDSAYITTEIERLCTEACMNIDDQVLNKIKTAYSTETSSLGKTILNQIIDNDTLASKMQIPMCQDTGITVVFAYVGQDLHINGSLEDAINLGVHNAYINSYLRKSVTISPIKRGNSGDNTPAIIHYKIVPGDKLKLVVAPKGAGSENMSKVAMLNPTDGINGITNFVLNTLKEAGGKACPPFVVGVGIGGNIEKCALLAKEALVRDICDESTDAEANSLEKDLYEKINKLNIGPMGLGGSTTCIAVKVNLYPCHIASLPVCVNIQCHASRHKEVIL